MRSKWLLLILIAGCYKATGPETCAGYLDYWFSDEADERWIAELFDRYYRPT